MTIEFYIADLRLKFKNNPYITFWRTDNAGYAYPLIWAGKYSKETVDGNKSYYCMKEYRRKWLARFPVPCKVAERLGIAPAPGRIDNDAGPVVANTPQNRRALRRAMYRPPERTDAPAADTTKGGV